MDVGGAFGGPRGRGCAQGVGVPPTLVDRVWAPGLDILPIFFIIPKIVSVKFQVIPGTFVSAHK